MRKSLRRRFVTVSFTLAVTLASLLLSAPYFRAADTLPDHLTDEQLWSMVAKTGFSEDCGSFRSENYLSNEISFQNVVAPLKAVAKTGGVYMGVGPEQNFTYMVALQPKMAFIVDVRCGNMREHMMYKALFELSDNRVDFLSRLFSRKRPAGLSNTASPDEIFAAFSRVQPEQALFDKNIMDIEDLLVKTHKFGLSADDLDGIDTIYRVFYSYGPEINYSASPFSGGGGRGGGNMPNYSDLMTATDQEGKGAIGMNRSFLGTEENFKIIRDLEKKNLIVPLVDNFAGPKAIRSVGKYLKDHDAVVSAFYLSNVEQYLFMDGISDMFYSNVKTLPTDASSTFLRSGRPGGNGGFGGVGGGLVSMLSSIQDVLKSFDAGQLHVWNDVIDLSSVP